MFFYDKKLLNSATRVFYLVRQSNARVTHTHTEATLLARYASAAQRTDTPPYTTATWRLRDAA